MPHYKRCDANYKLQPMTNSFRRLEATTIIEQMTDARKRTLQLIEGLDAEQLMGAKLATVNPLRWEIGHVAYFYEFWILRHHLKQAAIREDSDALFDSINIAHNDRWDLPLPSKEATLSYMQTVLNKVQQALKNSDDEKLNYLAQYAVFHEDMHTEAYTYTRQTHHFSAPHFAAENNRILTAKPLIGDAFIPGGRFNLGAQKHEAFVFDNEKWAYDVELKPFYMSKTAVSNGEYLKFVEAKGYQNKNLWSDDAWKWKEKQNLTAPLYWRQGDGKWQHKEFDQWKNLPITAAMIHVSWYEAQAYCQWAKRRLPSEVEWEAAAAAEPNATGTALSSKKRYFPWGNTEPTERQANLNGFALGTNDVSAHAEGDSAFGCRQMIGNVWEWTEDTFNPYPDFSPDMYADYSQPLFGQTKVLRGGAWTSRSRMIRNTWRTYYGADRNDVFAGFRTCAL